MGDRVRARRAARRASDRRAGASTPVVRVVAAALLRADRGDALPDVLARRDLGAAGRRSCSTCCWPSRAGCSPALPAAGIPAAIAVKVAYGAELLARADYDTSAAAASQGARRRRSSCSRARWPRRRCGPPRCRWTGGSSAIEIERGQQALPAARRCPAGSCWRCWSARWPRTRRGGSRDARATFSEGRYMDYSSRPAHAADVRGRQRADRQLARRAGRRSSASRCTGTGAGHVPAHLGPRAAAAAGEGQRRPLAVPGDAVGAGRRRARAAARRARDDPGRRPACGCGGPERHAHGAFVAAGAMLALHAGDRLGLGDAGAVRVAVRRGRRRAGLARGRGWASSGRTPRIVAALAVLVLAITPALFACSQPPLDRAVERVRASATAGRRSTRRWTATERFGTRPEPWQVLGYCDARLGQFDARPPRDGRRPLARPGQLAARLRPGDRLRRRPALDPRPYAARGAAAEPARPAAPARWSRDLRGREGRRPAGVRSRGGPRFRRASD